MIASNKFAKIVIESNPEHEANCRFAGALSLSVFPAFAFKQMPKGAGPITAVRSISQGQSNSYL